MIEQHPIAAGPALQHRTRAGLLVLAFITAFSGAMMPGPLLVATIQQTAVQGMIAVFGLIAGHALLELVVVGLLMCGLRAVVARRRVRATIGIVGGLALVWMGADMIRSAGGLTLKLDGRSDVALSFPKLILLGIAVCAANPYFTGWWATIGVGQLAHMAPRTPTEYLAFYTGHEAADLTWYAFVGFLIVAGKHWLTDGVYQGLIVACAVMLVLLGLWFLVTGIRLLIMREAMPAESQRAGAPPLAPAD